MRVSLNWVEHILGDSSIPFSHQELMDRLTRHVAEIDELEAHGPVLDGVVCGTVLTCEQHPQADRLSCTTVDVGGDEALPIVCGAPNVAAGQAVAVATVGTTLTMTDADGNEQAITIKKGKLRGQPSLGMICAEDELGLGTNHDGILVLDGEPQPGTPLADHLSTGDHVLVVDNHNINHRGDLWGHHGWAREIAALCNLPAPMALDESWSDQPSDVNVRIEDDDCLAYRGAVVRGVSNTVAPDWMREHLEAAGVRSLGLLVDITNYVMLETGEPMHAFDRRHLPDGQIIVRRATAGEKLTTLDDQARELSSDDLIIANGTTPMALAGIMGGTDSGVHADTNTIVLEAATFKAATIRQSRMRHGLATDSSSRFEKHLPPELTAVAINRALALLKELCPGCQVSSTFSTVPSTPAQTTVAFDPELITKLVGMAVPADEQIGILSALGFTITDNIASIPWWRRRDVDNGADLVEEVARIRGYDQVVPEVPRLPAAAPTPNVLRSSEHTVRRGLAARGWNEVQTYAFTSTEWAHKLNWREETTIALAHPLASDQSILRQSLLPTLSEAAGRNRRFHDRVAIFEVGKRYAAGTGSEPCCDERLVVAGLCCSAGDDQPFYAAREAALAALECLGFKPSLRANNTEGPDRIIGRSAEIMIGKQAVGIVSDLPPELRRSADLDDPAAWFSIELEELLERDGLPAPVSFSPPSRYQRVQRDFTFVCPENLSFDALASVALSATKGLGKDVTLAQPVFRGDGVDDGHKAISLRITLQAADRTLSDKDLAKVSKSVVGSVEHKTTARLRQ